MSFEEFKEEMHNKIINGEELNRSELSKLAYNADYDEYGDNRRWTQDVSSVIKLKDKYFMIHWDQGLTEMQEDEFYNQPFEVKQIETEKTIIVKEWVAIEDLK